MVEVGELNNLFIIIYKQSQYKCLNSCFQIENESISSFQFTFKGKQMEGERV